MNVAKVSLLCHYWRLFLCKNLYIRRRNNVI
nr:MAG TPA: hypothetical protein [Caudoviricetes sp.]